MVEFRPKFPHINQGAVTQYPCYHPWIITIIRRGDRNHRNHSNIAPHRKEIGAATILPAASGPVPVPSVISQGSNRVQSMIAATLLVSIYHDTNDTKAEKSLIKYLDLSIIVVNDG
jgi:hypothetical protein